MPAYEQPPVLPGVLFWGGAEFVFAFWGRIWNEYAVHTITVEHVVGAKFPKKYSSRCMTIATENYKNIFFSSILWHCISGMMDIH